MKKILIITVLFSSVFFFSGCSGGKYDGLTAEEWADEYYASEDTYQKFRTCVEDFESLSFQEKNQYGGIFYYCE
jgi:PBP1b-binding outer membrane lipoprotein LpoB